MMIRQILSNSVKYSEESTIHVHAYVEKGHTVLKITDEGKGISAKDLPRIFEKGFTSTSDRNETSASGLGLYLVNHVKEKLGVHVSVSSEPKVGTSMKFTFPKQNELISRISGNL